MTRDQLRSRILELRPAASDLEVDAVVTFIKNLKAKGLWEKMDRFGALSHGLGELRRADLDRTPVCAYNADLVNFIAGNNSPETGLVGYSVGKP